MPAGTVSNMQDNTVDETDNPHLTITQEQVSQYSQYMSTTAEQLQFTSAPQEQQQVTGLVSTSGDPAASAAVPMQPGVVDNLAGTTQQLLMPTWGGTGEPVTQSIIQTGDHPPHFNTAGIPGYNSGDNQFIGSNTNTTATEQNRDTSSSTMYSIQYGTNEAPTTYGEGLNAQYTGTNTQQPMTLVLPHANQPSLYSNYTSQVPGTEQPTDSHHLMPQQSLSTAQPVLSVPQPITGISQPPTSAVPTAMPPPPSSQSQQLGQKKEPSSKEDNGIVICVQ